MSVFYFFICFFCNWVYIFSGGRKQKFLALVGELNMPHQFDGYRVYNGCPDSTMQRRLDAEAKEEKGLIAEIEKYVPEVSVTYFPAPPSGYLAFTKHNLIENPEIPYPSKFVALNRALEIVKLN